MAARLSDGRGYLVGAQLTVAPAFSDAGMFTVSWTVSDGVNAPVPSSFVLIITNTNRAPVFNLVADVTMTAGTTRNVALVATDPDGDSVTFSSSSLPAWGSLMGATVTFTPQVSATVQGPFRSVPGRFDPATRKLSVAKPEGGEGAGFLRAKSDRRVTLSAPSTTARPSA